MLTKNAAPNQKIRFPIVSAILSVFEWNAILSAKIIICSMPMPMLNCISVEYRSICADGLAGAGKKKFEVGSSMGYVLAVILLKKSVIY